MILLQMGSIVTDDFYTYSCCHTIKLKRVLISWEQKTNLIQYFLYNCCNKNEKNINNNLFVLDNVHSLTLMRFDCNVSI